MALIRTRVRGLMMDERSKSPIVVLQEEDGDRILPIWIGEAEARAIGIVLAGETLERPLTHDLAIVSITITHLKDNTFFAEIRLDANGQQILVDARPSDSIALALRAEAAIYVDEAVMSSGQASGWTAPPGEKTEKDKAEELKKLLENMDPGDFGRFGI